MKKVSLFFAVLTAFVLTASLSSCVKTKYGNVVFWQMSGSGYGITVVSLNGVTSNITSEYSSAPECGASGCAVFNSLEEGTYNYTASDGTSNWSGSIEITEGCKTMKLY
jgi:hypothetical protein